MYPNIFQSLIGLFCIAAIFQFAQQLDILNRHNCDERFAPPGENNALLPIRSTVDDVRELIPCLSSG